MVGSESGKVSSTSYHAEPATSTARHAMPNMQSSKTYSNKSSRLVRCVYEVVGVDDPDNMLEFVRPMLTRSSVPKSEEHVSARLVDQRNDLDAPRLTSLGVRVLPKS